MSKSYLAFDLGASSGRAIIGKKVNGKLALQEVHRFKNFPVEYDGHFRWEIMKIFDEIKTGIKKAYAADPAISSISIDTWGVDYALFRDGELVRDPFCYRDARTEDIPDKLSRKISKEKLYGICGIQEMNFNTIYQLYAHKEEFPEDFIGTKLLFMPDALLFLLTGAVSCEYTIASTSALLDAKTRDWSMELIDILEFPRDVFPCVVKPSQSLPLSRAICDELGVPPLATVKVGSHDTASAVAAVPAMNTEGNWAYISSGTWALLGTELKSPFLSESAYLAKYTNEGGITGSIRFLTNIAGTWLLQETKRNWDEANRNISFNDMSEMAEQFGLTKFRIDPNTPGFLTPCDMPAKIREYCETTGQGKLESDAELVRCIYDSLAECFRDKLHILENILDVKYSALHILGGATRDTFLMQLTANALKIPIITGPIEATSTGNIISQMITSGELDSVESARKLVTESFEIGRFDPE